MIRIIPAIDLINGRCVRLERGDFNLQRIYDQDPLDMAKRVEDAGIEYLHLVDLDGARAKKIVNWPILQRITMQTSLQVDFGGGVQSDRDLQTAFDCGAKQVTAGSIAVKRQDLVINWIKRYGSDRIILGADSIDGKIVISGWQKKTSVDLFTLISDFEQKGIRFVVCTDVSRDGLLQGGNMELYRDIKSAFPNLFIIASGGISGIEEIRRLNELKIDGVIIGKAFYEGKITFEQLKDYLC